MLVPHSLLDLSICDDAWKKENKSTKFSSDELMWRTFIHTYEEGNYHYAAKVVRNITENDSKNENTIKFIVEIGEGKYDEILSYN